MSTMINYPVQIWNAKDELVSLTLFQLLQWKTALRLEIRTIDAGLGAMTYKDGHGGKKISTHVRKFLSAGRNVTLEDLYEHISDSLDDINEQLGV